MDLLNQFLICLIPIMVALDAPGVLPLYMAMTEGMKKNERKIIVRQSILTAFLITIGFVLIGRAVFTALGIKVEDFMIAGGIVLMIIAVLDMVRAGEPRVTISPTLGVVPLGTPLIAGPATLYNDLGSRRQLRICTRHPVTRGEHSPGLAHFFPGGPDHKTHRHQRIARLCQGRVPDSGGHCREDDQKRYRQDY